MRHDCRRLCLKGLGLAAMMMVGGCTFTDIDLNYTPESSADEIEEDTAKLVVGHFVDKRGGQTDEVGVVNGIFIFPRSVLRNEVPLAIAFRNIMVEGAKARRMLAEDINYNETDVYQIYGQIDTFSASSYSFFDGDVEIELVTRVFKVADNNEVYRTVRRVRLSNVDVGGSPGRLGRYIQQALNQLMQETLDSDEIRQILENGEVES